MKNKIQKINENKFQKKKKHEKNIYKMCQNES